MSAPSSPGGRSRVSASRSAATAVSAPRAVAASISGVRSRTAPDAPGYCSSTPNSSPLGGAAIASGVTAATTSSMPSGSARVASTVDGLRQAVRVDQEDVRPGRSARRAMVIASAAAVASSSSEAPAIGSPVRSATMVWKLSSASSRPCEISGWYGVYAVYQPGFSSTLRRITAGVTVP